MSADNYETLCREAVFAVEASDLEYARPLKTISMKRLGLPHGRLSAPRGAISAQSKQQNQSKWQCGHRTVLI